MTKPELVGSLIKDQYRVEQRLGKGGFAEVYLATDTKFGARKVAIKVLLPEFSSHDEDIRRFLDEAKITGNIHDPNRHLIQVYEFGHWDGLYCIVLEYLEGRSLRLDMDRRLRPLVYAEALDIAGQVCEGLAAAHKNGVAHRDLKPDNIFLCPTPYGTNVKILDLGIAKVVDSRVVGELQHRSRVGVILGTPAYLAPEMFAGKGVDYYLADIYSLGVVLYEMITGETPFHGESLAYYVYAHASVEPMRPSEVNTGIKLPEEVESLVMRCLAKQPANRFRTPEDLAGQIQAILAGETRSNRRPIIGNSDAARQEDRPSLARGADAAVAPPLKSPAPVGPVLREPTSLKPVLGPLMPLEHAPTRPVLDAVVQRPQQSRSPGPYLPPVHSGLPVAAGPGPTDPGLAGAKSPPPIRGEVAGPTSKSPASDPNETVIGLGFHPGMHRALPVNLVRNTPEQGSAVLLPAGDSKPKSVLAPPTEGKLERVSELACAPAPAPLPPCPTVQESESLRQVFVGFMLVAAVISIFTTGTLVLKIVDTSWMQAAPRPRPRTVARPSTPAFPPPARAISPPEVPVVSPSLGE